MPFSGVLFSCSVIQVSEFFGLLEVSEIIVLQSAFLVF